MLQVVYDLYERNCFVTTQASAPGGARTEQVRLPSCHGTTAAAQPEQPRQACLRRSAVSGQSWPLRTAAVWVR